MPKQQQQHHHNNNTTLAMECHSTKIITNSLCINTQVRTGGLLDLLYGLLTLVHRRLTVLMLTTAGVNCKEFVLM